MLDDDDCFVRRALLNILDTVFAQNLGHDRMMRSGEEEASWLAA